MNNIEKIKAVAAAAVNFSERSEYQELLSNNCIPVYDTLNEIHKLEDIEKNIHINLNDYSYNNAAVFNEAEEMNKFIVDDEYVTDIDDIALLLFLQQKYMKKKAKEKESDKILDEILGGNND